MIGRRPSLLVFAFIALANPGAAAGQAFPDGVERAFADWTVTCDNTHACWAQAFARDSETGVLSLKRQAGPDAELEIAFFGDLESAVFDTPGYEAAFAGAGDVPRFDDSPWGYLIAPVHTDLFIQALLDATTLSDSVSTIPLAGASAAMGFLDEVQGRAGTVTALVTKGNQPASAVPAASEMPVILAPATTAHIIEDEPGAALTAASVKTCGGENVDTPFEPEGVRLDDGREIWLMPCSSGMYNFIYAGLLKDGDAISELVFTGPKQDGLDMHELWNGHIATSQESVKSPDTALTLTTFERGRAMSDCGDMTEHVWTGQAFALVRHVGIAHCLGLSAINWPTRWQAEVKAE